MIDHVLDWGRTHPFVAVLIWAGILLVLRGLGTLGEVRPRDARGRFVARRTARPVDWARGYRAEFPLAGLVVLALVWVVALPVRLLLLTAKVAAVRRRGRAAERAYAAECARVADAQAARQAATFIELHEKWYREHGMPAAAWLAGWYRIERALADVTPLEWRGLGRGELRAHLADAAAARERAEAEIAARVEGIAS